MKNQDYKFFELARQEALKSDFGSIKIGCVLVYKNHIIGQGYNTQKTAPIQKIYNKKYRTFNKSSKMILDSLHAEMMALKSISYTLDKQIDYKKVRCYTYRICPGKQLGYGLSRPCPSCMAALKDKGVRQIFYTTDDGLCREKIF